MAGLICDVSRRGDTTSIKLSGSIDEDAAVNGLDTSTGPIEFHFGDVVSINSLGIRLWINLMKSLQGRAVTFSECSAVVVRQINMVPMFSGHARVVSVLAPYVCDGCNRETSVLVLEDEFDEPLPDTMPCEGCAQTMELEIPADRLFAFSKRVSRG